MTNLIKYDSGGIALDASVEDGQIARQLFADSEARAS